MKAISQGEDPWSWGDTSLEKILASCCRRSGSDRPSMSNVVALLSAHLPTCVQPSMKRANGEFTDSIAPKKIRSFEIVHRPGNRLKGRRNTQHKTMRTRGLKV